MINLGKYGKTIVALVGAGITWAGIVIHSPASAITATEWLTGAALLATSIGVYGVSNDA